MIKEIETVIMRISPNGEFLEYIANCPLEYHFIDFLIRLEGTDDYVSIAESIWGLEEDVQFINGQFPVSDLGVYGPAIYHIKLKARNDNADDPEWIETEDYPEIIEEKIHISDVSKAFDCLIDDIYAFDSTGNKDIQDRVIRNYLVLYGHLQALIREDYHDESVKLFNLLNNCFKRCSGDKNYRGNISGCGCNQVVYKDCGCKS